MASLYVASTETYSGKSALCIGLGLRMRQDGLQVGYMKPVNTDCRLSEGVPSDDDVKFARSVFDMQDPIERMMPVALTPARLTSRLRGPEGDLQARLQEAHRQIAAQRDVVVLEGGRNLAEGYLVDLPPRQVVTLLEAVCVLVLRHAEALLVDNALLGRDCLGERMVGVVINEVPSHHMEHVQEAVAPYLARHGIQVLGVVPKEPLLMAPSVAELAEGLHAEILCCPDRATDLVEHLLVGAMSVESALTYFRKKPNKAVVTGGDRADIQLAALETSTRCLILTGNLYPSPAVLNRAEELQVPILLANLDTLSTTEVVEGYFGQSRFQQPQKVSRFTALLDEHLDFPALYRALGLRR